MDGTRPPTRSEMSSGVPEWFKVQQSGKHKEYISPDGVRFDTVKSLKQWRESQVCMDEQPYF